MSENSLRSVLEHKPVVSFNGRFLSCECGLTLATIDVKAKTYQQITACIEMFNNHARAALAATQEPQPWWIEGAQVIGTCVYKRTENGIEVSFERAAGASAASGLRPVGGPFHEVLKRPSDDAVWIVEQNGRVHSVHATHESAMAEKGENLHIGAPWRVLAAAPRPELAPADDLSENCEFCNNIYGTDPKLREALDVIQDGLHAVRGFNSQSVGGAEIWEWKEWAQAFYERTTKTR